MRFAIIKDVRNLHLITDASKREVTHLVIHHSATLQGDAEAFYRYHVNDRGWADIGYHFVVNNGAYKPNGTIQLGRDRDDDDDVMEHQGAGVIGFNKHTGHIAGVGNLDEAVPDGADLQIIAIALIVNKLMGMYNIPLHRVIGHREAGLIEGVPKVYKTCPGANVDCNIMREYFYQIGKSFDALAESHMRKMQVLQDANPDLKFI